MKKLLILVLILLIFIVTGCHSGSTNIKITTKEVEASSSKRFIVERFEGLSLKNNFIDENTNRNIRVYLPPSYFISDKKYPVVYFLHGYQEIPDYISTITNKLDTQFINNLDNEFILVEPDANNKLNGSFYVNSKVTGQWEDYIIKDVINYIDSKYRTISDASSRAVCGFSMGGFGALNLGLKHTNVFSAAYIMSPGIFDKNGLKDAMMTWDSQFLSAYGAAFSPNANLEYPYANIPKFDGTSPDNRIVADWENGFGNIKEKVSIYSNLDQKLKGIRISCGQSDVYGWIINGTEYLVKQLNEAGIDSEYTSFEGGHEIEPGFADKELVKFISGHLKMRQ